VREDDGLALSSRNQRLTAEERQIAPMLYRALRIAGREGVQEAVAFLETEPRIRLEYLEAVNPEDVRPVSESERPVLLAIAAWIGKVRLIDNLLVPV
jgi:pantothenate synthetase